MRSADAGMVGEATLVDVARAAGVSPSTASRVLNGSTRAVLATNEARVRLAAERLGYVADTRAQATARRQPGAVAIIVGSLTDAAAMTVAAELHAVAERQGMTVTVHAAAFDGSRIVQLIRNLRGQRTRAVILIRPPGEGFSADAEREVAGYVDHGGVAHIVDIAEWSREARVIEELLGKAAEAVDASKDRRLANEEGDG